MSYLEQFFGAWPVFQHTMQIFLATTYCSISAAIGSHVCFLAMRFFSLRGVSGSADLVVFGSVVGRCSSGPFPLSDVAKVGDKSPADTADWATVGAGVAGGKTTLNTTFGTGTGATVADKAGVAKVMAGAVPDPEACVPPAELFLSCVTLPIFWRGFADAPTFSDFLDFLNVAQEEVEWPDTLQRRHAF